MEIVTSKARIKEAKNLANNLLKKCEIKTPPILLGVVIKYLQGKHNLRIYPAPNFSDKLSAILVTVQDKETRIRYEEIHFNQNHSWHRRRFSIAHEIGHLLFNTLCDSPDLDTYYLKSPNETEANKFASELLMPFEFLNSDFKAGVVDIGNLALKYIVSKESMGWRIANSNLLNKM